jgi:putative heme iron utilization protein
MTRPVLIAAAAILLTLGASARAADRVSSMYLKQVDLIEHDLVSLAQAMPAEKYAFRPAGEKFGDVRTFGEQVKHAATMIFMTAAIVLQEKSPYGPGTNNNGPNEVQGKDQIEAYLKASIAYALRTREALLESSTSQR